MTEQQAKEGLDICGYSGKWNKAVQSQAMSSPDYWANVRLYFLELGGGYLSEKCKTSDVVPYKLPDMSFMHEERQRRIEQPFFNPRRG